MRPGRYSFHRYSQELLVDLSSSITGVNPRCQRTISHWISVESISKRKYARIDTMTLCITHSVAIQTGNQKSFFEQLNFHRTKWHLTLINRQRHKYMKISRYLDLSDSSQIKF